MFGIVLWLVILGFQIFFTMKFDYRMCIIYYYLWKLSIYENRKETALVDEMTFIENGKQNRRINLIYELCELLRKKSSFFYHSFGYFLPNIEFRRIVSALSFVCWQTASDIPTNGRTLANVNEFVRKHLVHRIHQTNKYVRRCPIVWYIRTIRITRFISLGSLMFRKSLLGYILSQFKYLAAIDLYRKYTVPLKSSTCVILVRTAFNFPFKLKNQNVSFI